MGNMRVLGDVALASLVPDGAKLNEETGKGLTALSLGMDSLCDRARRLGISEAELPRVKQDTMQQFEKGAKLCESPIERSMLGALLTAPWQGFETLPPVVHNAANHLEPMPAGDVVIVPQMAFLRYRLDFGIILRSGENRYAICVECDGEEYHNDADKERRRGGYLASWGIPTYRFTGKAIYADANGCALRVAEGASKWWCAKNV